MLTDLSPKPANLCRSVAFRVFDSLELPGEMDLLALDYKGFGPRAMRWHAVCYN